MTKWAIRTKRGDYITYYTAAFHQHRNIVVHNWSGAAVFDRRQEARTIIDNMASAGVDTRGYRPVKVIQQLAEVA